VSHLDKLGDKLALDVRGCTTSTATNSAMSPRIMGGSEAACAESAGARPATVARAESQDDPILADLRRAALATPTTDD